MDVDLVEAEAGFAGEMGTGGDAFDEGGEGFGRRFLFERGWEVGFAGAFGGAGFEFAELAVVGFLDVGG